MAIFALGILEHADWTARAVDCEIPFRDTIGLGTEDVVMTYGAISITVHAASTGVCLKGYDNGGAIIIANTMDFAVPRSCPSIKVVQLVSYSSYL